MRTLVPKALRRGDTIGLISPSSHSAYPEKIQQAVTYIEKNGYRVKPSVHLNRIDTDPAIADEEKLHDLHAMFEDPEVSAIICLRGGAGASRLLNKINYRIIAENPKILVGYSDITALSLAVFSKTGLISFSGPMLATELHGPSPYTEEHFWGVLTSPSYIQRFRNHESHAITCIRRGAAEGRLIGGNLSVLSSMIGTPYMPAFGDTLLFIEDINEPAYRIDRMLSHLANAGLLAGCRGILFGQFSHEPGESADDARLEKVFNYYTAHTDSCVPVMRGLSYGHISNLMTLPVGVRCRLEVSETSFNLMAIEPAVAG